MDNARSKLRFELQELLLVAIGTVPGALLRWQLAIHLSDFHLTANTLGAALLGLLAGLPVAPRRQLLLGLGFCGSLSTFSGWMMDFVRLIAVGKTSSAIGLIGLTFGLGLGSAALGLLFGRIIGKSFDD